MSVNVQVAYVLLYNRQERKDEASEDNQILRGFCYARREAGMPYKPKVPCRHPGCSALVPAGELYCEKHKPLHLDEVKRPSASSRGYGKRWQKASRAFLHAHPLCERCLAEGRYVKATVVDHKVPHRGDQELFWDQSNWQALCKPCHDKKTFTEDVRPEYKF